ncbi:hypothetical protein [uncultured Roseobacter sp.]|uniref:hypothetical protein n=1 Tax=uncultured Roseobacter sp. TaxID=114847 RepID=UPI00260BAE73|nr:hypothetical protein [uncultured Roseobacter sp.]
MQRNLTFCRGLRAGAPTRAKLCLIPLICTLSTPAFAQSASFRSVDTNSDRVLSRDELVEAFGTSAAARLLAQSDHNQDGQITISELRQDSRRDADRDTDDSDENDDDDDDRDDDDDDRGDSDRGESDGGDSDGGDSDGGGDDD